MSKANFFRNNFEFMRIQNNYRLFSFEKLNFIAKRLETVCKTPSTTGRNHFLSYRLTRTQTVFFISFLLSTHFSTSVLSLGEHAAKLIKSLKNPIGVVSVAGYYRTGKSYLLNRMLLNRKRGFSTGDTVNACTKVKSVRV